MSYRAETVLVMVAVACACALPGVFLVLRRLALVTDAISHVLMFGIVTAYLVVKDLASPWLLAGAAASGVLTVALVELLQRSKRVKEDAAIGLVFPALFAVGTILATLYAKNTHLDVDRVLLGSAEFSTLDRFVVAGRDLGPRGFVVLTAVFAATALLGGVLYKELKLAAFDAGLAAAMGFLPGVLHYGLMTAVSLTAVAAFDAVGPVLVVAFFVVPAATAYLLTDRLSRMMGLSVLVAAGAAVVGTRLAFRWDTSIAGTTATVLGAAFGLTFLLAPGRGLVAQGVRRWRQRRAFAETMLAVHLLQHEGTPAEADESRYDGLHRHLQWPPEQVAAVVGRAERHGLVVRAGDWLRLTDAGRGRAREVFRSPA